MTANRKTRSHLKQRVAILGMGKMGGILLRSFFEQGLLSPRNTVATVRHREKAQKLSRRHRIRVTTDNHEAARVADVILLCVKPQAVRSVVEEIAPVVHSKKLVVSIAASVPTQYIERFLSTRVPVIRAMPNTPCMVGSGMTGLCRGKFAAASQLNTARRFFETVGRTVIVEEKQMDAVTGLSASGPAFIYIILESLAEAGVKVGLPRDVATLLAAQTAEGASRVVLETGDHPALLKDTVTTPAGCTIDGILELEEGKLRVTLIKAVVKASQRAKELLLDE